MKNYFDQVQDYLDDNLSEEALRDFEKELSINEELKQEVNEQQKLIDLLKRRIETNKGLESFHETLESKRKIYFDTPSLSEDLSSSTTKTFSLRKWSVSIGIAATLLIGLNFLGVFSTNLNKLPVLQSEITRSGSEEGDVLNTAVASFNEKDYKKSIQLFSELAALDSTNTRFNHYLGLSYVGDERWQEAIDVLVPLANGSSLYREDAAYFVALSAWELKDYNLTKEYADKVSVNNSYYKKAQKLLKK